MCKYICTSAIKPERIAINVDKWVIGGRGRTGTHLRGILIKRVLWLIRVLTMTRNSYCIN